MKFLKTPLKGNFIIENESKKDDRGFFARMYCESEFKNHSINTDWVQINNSSSNEIGTLRGLHFQYPPYSEAKLVRCTRGAIWNVCVDLRHKSNTYGKWFGIELNEDNRSMIYIPRGFANGYISLKKNSEIIYLVSDFYSPESEGVLMWNDPSIAINWPIKPIFISQKDREGDNFLDFKGLDIVS